jgi:hypothetical protein
VRNWVRAISTSRITPRIFKVSSVVGPTIAAPHSSENCGLTVLESTDRKAEFAVPAR